MLRADAQVSASHSFMPYDEFERIQQPGFYLEENAIFIFLCDDEAANGATRKVFEDRLEIFGHVKKNVRVVELPPRADDGGDDVAAKTRRALRDFAAHFGVGPGPVSRCPAAVYVPRWLSVPETLETNSYEVTFDLDPSDDHLIKWMWHHLDIKARSVFHNQGPDAVRVFWYDPTHKKEWPSFALRPGEKVSRDTRLGHQFYLRKRIGMDVSEASYEVKHTETLVRIHKDKIDWYELWSADPDHPETAELGDADVGDEEKQQHMLRGSVKFRRRRFRLPVFRMANPALVMQAVVGSMIVVLILALLIISTAVRLAQLVRGSMRSGRMASRYGGGGGGLLGLSIGDIQRRAAFASTGVSSAFRKTHRG